MNTLPHFSSADHVESMANMEADASCLPFVEVHDLLCGLREQLNNALLGKSTVVEHLLACVLSRGHLLFDDSPGSGRTTIAKALALSIGGKFARVQCTPDMMPNDVTGFNILNPKNREFEFRKGPVFSDVLLADDIHRAMPRTQNAFFEAMAEKQVTIDGEPRMLKSTLVVLVTQNTGENIGTHRLTETQLDRFSMKLRIGYPDRKNEIELLARNGRCLQEVSARRVLKPGQLEQLQGLVADVIVEPLIQEYLVSLAEAIRSNAAFSLGISPRGLLQWQRLAQARALLVGRDFVTTDDIQHVGPPLLAVRLTGRGCNVDATIDSVLNSVPMPKV